MNTLLKFHLKNCFKNIIIYFCIVIFTMTALVIIFSKDIRFENTYFFMQPIIFITIAQYTIENYFFFIQQGCTRKTIMKSLLQVALIISLFSTLFEVFMNILFTNVMNAAYINNISPLALITGNTSITNIIIYIILGLISNLAVILSAIAIGLYYLKVPKSLFFITIVLLTTSPITLLLTFRISGLDNLKYILQIVNYFYNNFTILSNTIINSILCLFMLTSAVFLNKRVRK